MKPRPALCSNIRNIPVRVARVVVDIALIMTRTCSSQTIHYCIGFLHVAGWQSCWYWKVLPASSRMLRRCVGLTVFILKRFHIVTICVKFGASTCIGDRCAQIPEFFCNPYTRSASKYLNLPDALKAEPP